MDMRGAGSAGPSTGRAAHGGSAALALRLSREEKRSRYLVLSACG